MAGEDVVNRIAQSVATIACRKCHQHLDVGGLDMFSVIVCPNCQTKQKVPAQLTNFLLYDVMGRGGMAAVYRAYDVTLGRHVAIKVMRRELSEDPKFIDNFLREARSAAQINHRNVVQIYQVGQVEDQPFIVMELLDGGRLDEMIGKQDALDEARVLEIGLGVAEGLEAASRNGLVHGDIKPANILFDRDGTPKVADFGLARFQTKKMAQGEIWGTPYYIAPEKVVGKKEDLRSDMYSLGATLFNALSGQPPFEGETATDVVLARLNQLAPDLGQIRPDLNPATVKLVARMLETEPNLRHPNYISLVSDFRKTIEQVRSAPPPTATKTKIKAILPDKKHHLARTVIGIVAVIVIIGAVIGMKKMWKGQDVDIPDHVPPPPPATTVATTAVQPFSAAEQEKILAFGRAVNEGKVNQAETDLAAVVKAIPKEHGGRPWMAVFMATPPWIAADRAETERRLSNLTGAQMSAGPGGSPNSGLLAQAAARVMLGTAYQAPAAKNLLPGWYEPLVGFFQSGELMRQGKLDDAALALDRYLAWKGEDPSWPRLFQPVAAKWRKAIDEWSRIKGYANDRMKKGQKNALLQEIEKFQKEKAVPLMATDIERELARIKTGGATRLFLNFAGFTQPDVPDGKTTQRADGKFDAPRGWQNQGFAGLADISGRDDIAPVKAGDDPDDQVAVLQDDQGQPGKGPKAAIWQRLLYDESKKPVMIAPNQTYVVKVWIGRRNRPEPFFSAPALVRVSIRESAGGKAVAEAAFNTMTIARGQFAQQTFRLNTGGQPAGAGNQAELYFEKDYGGMVLLDSVEVEMPP